MIVLNILGYFGRNKQNSYAALSRATILLSHSKYDRHWTGPILIINWHNSYLFLPKNEVKHYYYYFICFNSDIALSFLIFSLVIGICVYV